MIFLRGHQTLESWYCQSAHSLVKDSSGCPRKQNTLVTVMQGGFPWSTGQTGSAIWQLSPLRSEAAILFSRTRLAFLGGVLPIVHCAHIGARPFCLRQAIKGPEGPAPVEEPILGPQDQLPRPRSDPFFMKSPLNVKVALCVGKIMATP